jgi:hypothetical protein
MDYGESEPIASNKTYSDASKRYTSTRQTMVIQEEDEQMSQDTDRAAATESRRDVKRGSKASAHKDIMVDAASEISSKSSVRHRRGGGSTVGPLGGVDSSSNLGRTQPDSGATFKKITTGKLGFRASNALASI